MKLTTLALLWTEIGSILDLLWLYFDRVPAQASVDYEGEQHESRGERLIQLVGKNDGFYIRKMMGFDFIMMGFVFKMMNFARSTTCRAPHKWMYLLRSIYMP